MAGGAELDLYTVSDFCKMCAYSAKSNAATGYKVKGNNIYEADVGNSNFILIFHCIYYIIGTLDIKADMEGWYVF